MTPRTSVITLTYKRPEYLSEAIASVEAQTDSDWEHIVYDNNSEDPRVVEILKAAKNRNPDKFFYIIPDSRGPENVVGHYWNLLINIAKGRYITILDDDNRKKPTFLENMLAPMEVDTTLEAVTCGWSKIDAKGAYAGADVHWNRTTSLEMLCRTNTIDSNSLVFRRSVVDKIGKFDATLTTNEDWHFNVRLVRLCKVKHLQDALVDYREHSTMRSKNVVQLGASANHQRIRQELYTEEEIRNILGPR